MQYLPPPSCFASSPSRSPAKPAESGRFSHENPGREPFGTTDPARVPEVAAGREPSVESFTRDARNLLTALVLYADLLNAPGVLPQQQRRYLQELCRLADRGRSLLGHVPPPHNCDEVLENDMQPGASRRSTGFCSEPLCDAAAVLARLLPDLQAGAQGSARVSLRLGRSLPALPVSGRALEQITANLVGTAVARMCQGNRSTRALGSVWIALDARNGVARLCVEDSGTGVTPAVAGPGALEWPLRGSEYGLIHNLVLETGGRLHLRPRPSGGMVFTVQWTLPAGVAVQVFGNEARSFFGGVVPGC